MNDDKTDISKMPPPPPAPPNRQVTRGFCGWYESRRDEEENARRERKWREDTRLWRERYMQ